MTLGLVLSGGGARGAYEAGVLSYIYGPLQDRLKRTPPFQILSGTSIGGLHAASLAAEADDPTSSVVRLCDTWRNSEMRSLLRFGWKGAFRLSRILSGSEESVGVFDNTAIVEMAKAIPYEQITTNLRERRISALTISTTQIASGKSVVFFPPESSPPNIGRSSDRVSFQKAEIGVEHVTASAAIPSLFPPVNINGKLYCDGGLRLNTPLAPAIYFGADRVLVIALSTSCPETPLIQNGTPSLAFVMGKLLNAFLLDHVSADIEHLEHINRILEDGVKSYGNGFLEQMSEHTSLRGEPRHKIVRPFVIRPSVDLGKIAMDVLRENSIDIDGPFWLQFLKNEHAADLASYLLFDPAFTRILIELGFKDAKAVSGDLEKFLFAEE